jgi:hypothetical protein
MSMTTKSIRFLVCSALALGLGAPAGAYASGLNNSEKPGSVLVFPKFRTGTVQTLEGEPGGSGIRPRTEFEISAVCAKGAEGTSCANLDGHPVINLMAHWVCEGSEDPEDFNRCRERDFTIQTTVNGTVYFSPEGTRLLGPRETLVPPPPCNEGYLIVWAIDQFGKPIAYDGLIGDAILRRQGTLLLPDPDPLLALAPLSTASAYNAIPIQASNNLRVGDLTDLDGDGALDFGSTDFGFEYLSVTGRIIGTVRYPGPSGAQFGRIETELTLLTLDVLSNRVNTPTDVDLVFYNEAECPISESLSFVCWETEELDDQDLGGDTLTSSFGRKGLVESGTAQQAGRDVTLLGLIETREIDVDFGLQRDYAYSLFNDGVAVTTAFDPGNAPTVPPPPQPPLTCEQPENFFNNEVIPLSSRFAAPTIEPVLEPVLEPAPEPVLEPVLDPPLLPPLP